MKTKKNRFVNPGRGRRRYMRKKIAIIKHTKRMYIGKQILCIHTHIYKIKQSISLVVFHYSWFLLHVELYDCVHCNTEKSAKINVKSWSEKNTTKPKCIFTTTDAHDHTFLMYNKYVHIVEILSIIFFSSSFLSFCNNDTKKIINNNPLALFLFSVFPPHFSVATTKKRFNHVELSFYEFLLCVNVSVRTFFSPILSFEYGVVFSAPGWYFFMHTNSPRESVASQIQIHATAFHV